MVVQWPLPLLAEVRSSASYVVEAESLDGAGGLSVSPTYTNHASLEPLVSGKSNSAGYAVMHGYITALTLPVLNTYDTWVQARGLTKGVNDGYLDDPNNDGRPNINHFAFDTDPTGNGADECKRVIDTIDLGGMDYLTLTLPIRKGALFNGLPLTSDPVSGLIYEILGDSDLNDPWDLQLVEVVPALDAGLPSLGDYDDTLGEDWEYRTFRHVTPLSAAERYFLKAGVRAAP